MSLSFQCKVCSRREMPVSPAKCEAFPHGIPEEILSGEVSHTEPIAGDGGKTHVLGKKYIESFGDIYKVHEK